MQTFLVDKSVSSPSFWASLERPVIAQNLGLAPVVAACPWLAPCGLPPSLSPAATEVQSVKGGPGRPGVRGEGGREREAEVVREGGRGTERCHWAGRRGGASRHEAWAW